MSKIDTLLDRYEQNVGRPWRKRVDGSERVWFVVYPPDYEREIRARIDEFRLATKRAGHDWSLIDLTDAFPEWMAQHDDREGHFDYPEGFDLVTDDFRRDLAADIRKTLADADEDGVVALTGIGTLFGLIYVSNLVEELQSNIQGRLVVFFPGRHENNTYRLLDARDGWDYLAMPIKA